MKRNIILRWFVPVLMCVFPLLMPKSCGRDFWTFIIGYTALAMSYFYFSSFRKSIMDDWDERVLILNFMLQKLELEAISFKNISYRARIFQITQRPSASTPISLLFKKHLKEITGINMEGENDRNIICYPYKGAPGLCWMIRSSLVYDFSALDDDKAKPWRLTHEEVELLKGVGATICMPLFKSKEIKGCLCIDAKNRLEDTPFKEKQFQKSLDEWCKSFALLI